MWSHAQLALEGRPGPGGIKEILCHQFPGVEGDANEAFAGSSAAVAGVLTLGLAGASAPGPVRGSSYSVRGPGLHAAAHAPAVTPAARIRPGSVWTMNSPGAGCNIWTFASSGNGVTTDTGFTGTYSKPTANSVKAKFPTAPAKYKGTYSAGTYTGKLVLSGAAYPSTTLTPGADVRLLTKD